MRPIPMLALLCAFFAAFPAAARGDDAQLRVEGTEFVLTLADGSRLRSKDLVGAVLASPDGLVFRIDSVEAARENPGVLLHHFSTPDPQTGGWMPACDADAYGRTMGFPVAGAWKGSRFVRDRKAWFLTCTSGSQGKCLLWGYDPWQGRGDSARLYQACQFMVRADYRGDGDPHTRNGTTIDIADIEGIQRHDSTGDPAFAFEAGWGLRGAVCVARTRWPDLIAREALVAAEPRLGGQCNEAEARKRGALLFTRVRAEPPAEAR